MSFRSVIKTKKKEYGQRGKESIHSFRKTMHVRDKHTLYHIRGVLNGELLESYTNKLGT